LESDSVLEEDVADAAKIGQQSGEISRSKEDIIDDDAAAKVRRMVRVTKTKAGIPFVLKDAHHCGIKCMGVVGSEWHDDEGIFFMIRSKEGKLGLITGTDKNLVIAGLVIKADKIEAAG
jgi:hypothetical protein